MIIDFTVEEVSSKYIFTKEKYPAIEDLVFVFVKVKYASKPSSKPWAKLKFNDTYVGAVATSEYTFMWKLDALKGFWDYGGYKSENPTWYNSNSDIIFSGFSDILYFVKYEKINQISVESFQNFLDVGTVIQIYGY